MKDQRHYEGTHPDQNKQRIERIEKIVAKTGDIDKQAGVRDILTDTMHYCAANDIDFELELDIARRGFRAEYRAGLNDSA